jgi:hypothetical protein
MTEKYFFADVEQPFHVWVKEGRRWVLRDAGAELDKLAGLASRGASGAERGAGGCKSSNAG